MIKPKRAGIKIQNWIIKCNLITGSYFPDQKYYYNDCKCNHIQFLLIL